LSRRQVAAGDGRNTISGAPSRGEGTRRLL